MKAIYILWLRQVKRYYRSPERIIGLLGQPVLFLIAFSYGFGPIYKAAGQGNYIQFLVPGIIGMSVLVTAVISGIEVLWDKQFGFLKETLVSPVPRINIMIGRTLGGATAATIQGIIVFIISLFIGFKPYTLSLLPVALLFIILLSIFFTAFGTAIASLMQDMQGFQLIINFLMMPIFFLSGALFPINNIPGDIKIVTVFNPLSYGIDGIRDTLTKITSFGVINDFYILFFMTVFILIIGAFIFSKIQI